VIFDEEVPVTESHGEVDLYITMSHNAVLKLMRMSN